MSVAGGRFVNGDNHQKCFNTRVTEPLVSVDERLMSESPSAEAFSMIVG
jgi:hypothetical protein